MVLKHVICACIHTYTLHAYGCIHTWLYVCKKAAAHAVVVHLCVYMLGMHVSIHGKTSTHAQVCVYTYTQETYKQHILTHIHIHTNKTFSYTCAYILTSGWKTFHIPRGLSLASCCRLCSCRASMYACSGRFI